MSDGSDEWDLEEVIGTCRDAREKTHWLRTKTYALAAVGFCPRLLCGVVKSSWNESPPLRSLEQPGQPRRRLRYSK